MEMYGAIPNLTARSLTTASIAPQIMEQGHGDAVNVKYNDGLAQEIFLLLGKRFVLSLLYIGWAYVV